VGRAVEHLILTCKDVTMIVCPSFTFIQSHVLLLSYSTCFVNECSHAHSSKATNLFIFKDEIVCVFQVELQIGMQEKMHSGVNFLFWKTVCKRFNFSILVCVIITVVDRSTG